MTRQEDGDRIIVTLEGEIDVYTAPRLRELLIDSVTSWKHIYPFTLILDFERVEFLDSTGLGILTGALKRMIMRFGQQYEDSLIPCEQRETPYLNPQGGPIITIVCTQERILKIFRITGLAKIFAVRDSYSTGG